jgi:hypothetical protein
MSGAPEDNAGAAEHISLAGGSEHISVAGASEHISIAGAPEHISLDAAITKLKHHKETDERASEILAAAITLRDSTGRDRKESLQRLTARSWGVSRRLRVDGKWKNRPLDTIAKDLQAAVCDAALRWECQMAADTVFQPVQKKTKTGGAAEHADVAANHVRNTGGYGAGDAASSSTPQPSAGTVCELPQTPNDVTSLSRLGPDMFEAKLRSGEVWRGDSQLLSMLSQGDAKRATLETREFMARTKAMAKPKANIGEDTVPLAKRQKTLGEMFHKASHGSDHGGVKQIEPGAPEHGGGIARDADPARPQEEAPASPVTTSGDLFIQDVAEDRALLDWLRDRQEHPRCVALLRQIMEWSGICKYADMRLLVTAQNVQVTRQGHRDTQHIREAARRHFKAAVAQEKGRLACFQLGAIRGASEHLSPLASEAGHVINATDVVDLRTLILFRRQRSADMPDRLRQGIVLVAGGYTASRRNLRDLAKLFRVTVQTQIQYPGETIVFRQHRRVQFPDSLRMTMLRSCCFRQVRAWATTSTVSQTTSLSTPQTVLELAAMLRDTTGNLRCPFGTDFEGQSGTGPRTGDCFSLSQP